MGQDGVQTDIHAAVAIDKYGFTLNYFDGDYNRINPSSPHFEADYSISDFATHRLISSMAISASWLLL